MREGLETVGRDDEHTNAAGYKSAAFAVDPGVLRVQHPHNIPVVRHRLHNFDQLRAFN